MVLPNFCRICSNSPVKPPNDNSWRVGVRTVAGIPSSLAPGSEVKFSGDGVLPYRPQPIATPSTTSTAAVAALMPHPAR